MLGWAKLTDNSSLVQGECLISTAYFLSLIRSAGSDFPWKELPSGTTFCDIGGGIGHVSLELAKAHPHLKVTVQDLPDVIDQARDVSRFPRSARCFADGDSCVVLDQRIPASCAGATRGVCCLRFHEGGSRKSAECLLRTHTIHQVSHLPDIMILDKTCYA